MTFSGTNLQSGKRQRVQKACIPCRKRKRKCDGKQPCGMCSDYGYECQYTYDDGPLTEFKVKRLEKRLFAGRDEVSVPVAHLTAEESKKHTANEQKAEESKKHTANERKAEDTRPVNLTKSTDQHSAVGFPRTLGLELQSANPPRLHSFGWHCGVRPEEKSSKHGPLSELLTVEECRRFTKVFFTVVHPFFNFIDEDKLKLEVEKCWNGTGENSDYGAVIAGVISLGSFFSGTLGHPRELDIVKYAKCILDDPAFSRVPSIEQVSAWILRTIYLRTAAPPHVAWLASCTSLHLAEVIGLHQEIDGADFDTNTNSRSRTTIYVREYARRIFWCAWTTNTILSYDYGCTSVNINKRTCKSVKESKSDYLAHLVKLAQLIPREYSSLDPTIQTTELLNALKCVYDSPDVHAFISLTKADLCLSFYRRLRLLNHVLDKGVILQITSIGNTALSAAYHLAKIDQAWWSVLSTSFQYVCVLLAIDTPESLLHVTSAMSMLDSIVQTLGTTVALEAQNTAKLLLQDLLKRKNRQIQQLESATHPDPLPQDNRLLDIDWDVLLDPSYTFNFL
ncbi:hypothetical protein HG535_0B00250 [Zygotorulaspora mrakii]|uniref:Zn(2)-C6 fungal-type domain-containing protein n=1 Tax=Zygotorulaspora mrakii TaxID=42260 RepID=A0A7H9AX45_ZYGMR|nr:uncharacterized protein HG535_0B00250 [Zygotorulaspora mrakii]QLG70988.1 hypothetical protein HG535_0B00250 [Zygotorulaspora mrakii]